MTTPTGLRLALEQKTAEGAELSEALETLIDTLGVIIDDLCSESEPTQSMSRIIELSSGFPGTLAHRIDSRFQILKRLPDSLTLGEVRGVLELFEFGISHDSSPVDNDHRLVSGDAGFSVGEAGDGADRPVRRRHRTHLGGAA